jgi:hypothetical protein
MGSFNELVLCVEVIDDRCIFNDEAKDKNQLFDELRDCAWRLASEIKREQTKIT